MNRTAPAESLRAAYLRLDARTLGFGRIVLGLVLIADLLRRVPWIRDFYSNAGLIPNHTVLWRPPIPRVFSFFLIASLPEEAVLWFVICFICFFLFLIGYRTRLFHVLSFVMVTSLHNRILFAENWGGVAMGALHDLDHVPAHRAPLFGRRRARQPARAPGRDARRARGRVCRRPTIAQPPRSPCSRCCSSSRSFIGSTSFTRRGPTWRQGTAVHYVLRQERIITGFGLWFREHVPYVFTKLLTMGTLVIEARRAVPDPDARVLAMDAPAGGRAAGGHARQHRGLVNLGIFSAAMIAYQPFLLTEPVWGLLDALVPRRGRVRQVFYDADCGVLLPVRARAGAPRRPPTVALAAEHQRRCAAGRVRRHHPRTLHLGGRSGARSTLDARRCRDANSGGLAARVASGPGPCACRASVS